MSFCRSIRLLALAGSLGLSACSFENIPGVTMSADGTTGFVADGSRGQFNGEALTDPNTATVKVGFTSLVRLRDPLSGLKLPTGLEFETLVSETPEWPEGVAGTPAVLNTDGDLPVQGTLEYRDLGPATYFRRYLLVRAKTAPYEGIVRATEIYLNPWQRDDLFYRDAKLQGAPVFADAPVRAKIVLPNYTAVFLERRFEIEEHLQLTTLRHYALNLKPGIVRPNPKGVPPPQPLRPGTRLMLTGTLSDAISRAPDAPAFLSAFEIPVQVDAAGEINTTLVFSVGFTDQPRLDSRTRLHLSLRALDEEVNPGLLTAAFVANPNGNDTTSGQTIAADQALGFVPALPLNPQKVEVAGGISYTTRMEFDGSPTEMLAKYWRGYGPVVPVQLGETPPEGWLSWNGWMQSDPPMPLAFKGIAELLEADAGDLTRHTHQTLQPFCLRAPSFGESERAQCQSHPEDFFHLSQYTLVDSVLNKVPEVIEVNNPFVPLNAAYLTEKGLTHRKIEADKTSDHAVFGAVFKLMYDILGTGGGVQGSYNKEWEWYSIKESAVADQERARMTVQEQVMLSQEEIVLNLDLKLRRCVLVRPLRFLLAVTQSQSRPIPSFLFCAQPYKPEGGVEESWFSLRDRWNAVHSAHSDPKDPRERGWTKLVRGQETYSFFKKAIADETRGYFFKKISPFFDGVNTLAGGVFYTPPQIARLTRDGGIFPGVLSLRTSSSLKWNEPQIARYTELCRDGFKREAKNASQAEAQSMRYCRCFYEGAARRWDHAEFVKQSDKFESQLDASPVGAQCLAFMKSEGEA